MTLYSDKQIICLKDIDSNIIDEAILVLKSNVLENTDNSRTREIIINEAEEIIENVEIISDNTLNSKSAKIVQIGKELLYILGLLILLGVCISVAF